MLYASNGNIILRSPDQYLTESNAVFALFSGGNALTDNEKFAMDIFIRSQVACGNWRHIHTFKIGRRLSSETKCWIDWKGVRNGTGTGTWNIATGSQTNGSSTYVELGFIESTDATNFDGTSTLNNIGWAIELTSNDHGTSAGTLIGGTGSNTNNQMRWDQASGGVNQTWKTHGSSTITTALGAFTPGFRGIYRSLSNRQGLENNWDAITTNTTASAGIPNVSLSGGAFNNNGTRSSYMAAKIGTFTAFNYNAFDYNRFFVNWQFMMQMLGDTKEDLYPYDLPVRYYLGTDGIGIIQNGQSNSSGRANGASSYLTSTPIYNTLVAWRNPPIMATPMSVQNLQYGVNNTYENLAENGYELAMCHHLATNVYAKVILLKYAISGTSLKPGVTDPDWSVSANELANVASNLIAIAGLQTFDDTYTVKKIFLVWDQGEADVNGTTQSEYATQLSLLIKYHIDNLQSAGYNLANIEFHVIIRKIYGSLTPQTTLSQIRAAEDGAEADFNSTNPSYTALVRSWKVFNTDAYNYPDGTHLSPRAFEQIGIKLGLYCSRR